MGTTGCRKARVEILHSIDSEGGLAVLVLEARKTGDFSEMPPDINPRIHHRWSTRHENSTPLCFATSYVRTRHCLPLLSRRSSHGSVTAILLWALGVPWDSVRETLA